MLKTINETLFLHSLGLPIVLHRSQYAEFAKAGANHGLFEARVVNGKTEYVPTKTLKITRAYYRNKLPGKFTELTWRKGSIKPVKSPYQAISWDEAENIKKPTPSPDYKDLLMGTFKNDSLKIYVAKPGRNT